MTTPVRGATLIGNGLEVLRGIDAVADDLEVKAGMCGKEGQTSRWGAGSPLSAMREITVGGTSLWSRPHARRAGSESRSPLEVARMTLAMSGGLGAEVEAYVERGRTVSIKTFGGEVESVTVAEPSGLGVRAIREGRTGYAFTSDLSEEGVRRVLERASGQSEGRRPR